MCNPKAERPQRGDHCHTGKYSFWIVLLRLYQLYQSTLHAAQGTPSWELRWRQILSEGKVGSTVCKKSPLALALTTLTLRQSSPMITLPQVWKSYLSHLQSGKISQVDSCQLSCIICGKVCTYKISAWASRVSWWLTRVLSSLRALKPASSVVWNSRPIRFWSLSYMSRACSLRKAVKPVRSAAKATFRPYKYSAPSIIGRVSVER